MSESLLEQECARAIAAATAADPDRGARPLTPEQQEIFRTRAAGYINNTEQMWQQEIPEDVKQRLLNKVIDLMQEFGPFDSFAIATALGALGMGAIQMFSAAASHDEDADAQD